jgi:hypothetical protein
MISNIDRKMKKEIIEKNLENIKLIKNKTYMNNSFALEVGSEGEVPEFEKIFRQNLTKTILAYFEDQNIDPKKYNRSITYSVNNTKKNVVINF